MAKKKKNVNAIGLVDFELELLLRDLVYVRDNMSDKNQDFYAEMISNLSMLSYDNLSGLKLRFDRALGNRKKDSDVVEDYKSLTDALKEHFLKDVNSKSLFKDVNRFIRMARKIRKLTSTFELE